MTQQELEELGAKIRMGKASPEERQVFIKELKKNLQDLQTEIKAAKEK